MSSNGLRTRSDLKSSFETGDRPSGDDFSGLIDSSLNQIEDGIYATDGKVGLGTDAPNAHLEINGGTGDTRQTLLVSDGDNSTFRVAHPEPDMVVVGSNDGQQLRLGHFKPDGSFFTTRILVDNDGNVGIGNSTPQSKLHVQGKLKVDKRIALGECELIFHKGKLFLVHQGVNYIVQMEKANSKPPEPKPTPPNLMIYLMFFITLIASITALYFAMYYHLDDYLNGK